MKFIESTNFFLRTIMFDFENRDKNIRLKFRLVPMIHIGSEAFYQQAFKKVNACEEIFYEGARVKGIRVYTKLFKRMAEKLNLVTQHEAFNYKALKGKLIHADFNTSSGDQAWHNLKWTEKLKLHLFDPAKLFVQSRYITRAFLAKTFMTANEELLLAYGPVDDEPGTAENLITPERNQIVIQHIKQKFDTEAEQDKTIGILYGAGHMKAIARYLIDQLKFKPTQAEFMKVFDVYQE